MSSRYKIMIKSNPLLDNFNLKSKYDWTKAEAKHKYIGAIRNFLLMATFVFP